MGEAPESMLAVMSDVGEGPFRRAIGRIDSDDAALPEHGVDHSARDDGRRRGKRVLPFFSRRRLGQDVAIPEQLAGLRIEREDMALRSTDGRAREIDFPSAQNGRRPSFGRHVGSPADVLLVAPHGRHFRRDHALAVRPAKARPILTG